MEARNRHKICGVSTCKRDGETTRKRDGVKRDGVKRDGLKRDGVKVH
jgi:hypothetical protein